MGANPLRWIHLVCGPFCLRTSLSGITLTQSRRRTRLAMANGEDQAVRQPSRPGGLIVAAVGCFSAKVSTMMRSLIAVDSLLLLEQAFDQPQISSTILERGEL